MSQVIGVLTQHEEFEDWWESKPRNIPFFEDKELVVTFMDFDPRDDKAFVEEADAALETFLAMKATDRLAISQPVYQNCMDFLEAVGYDEDDQPLWDIKDPQAIWRFVNPQEVHVSRRHRRDGDLYLSLMCECSWEHEHGLQLVFRQGRSLTRVSSQDGWLTQADAFGLADEADELLSQFE